MERELTHSIHAHYGMVEVQDHVVMPDHLHAIVVVRSDIVSSSGSMTSMYNNVLTRFMPAKVQNILHITRHNIRKSCTFAVKLQ